MMDQGKKAAIVLGGIAAHCELIRQLKQRGYYTILVDYFENPPAKSVADVHVRESTMDQEKVLEIARKYHADLVLSGCVDQANVTAAYVSEQMGLFTPYSYEKAKKITNKVYMKQVMMEYGIPTSRYQSVESVQDALNMGLRYPVMVKPADSNSSNGVKKARDVSELKDFVQQALEISRNHKAIVEEFVEGAEINAYCYIQNHQAKLLMTAERISVIEGEDKVLKCYATITPARISEQVEKKAEKIASDISNVFDLDHTVLFFQGIVVDDELYVIEFAPRAGGGTCFKTILHNTGLDVIKTLLDVYTQTEVDLSTWHKSEKILLSNTFYANDCIYDHLVGKEELFHNSLVLELFHYKTQGMAIKNDCASGGRIGAFLVQKDSMEEALLAVKQVYEKLQVFDVEGREVLRRDLNLYSRRGSY